MAQGGRGEGRWAEAPHLWPTHRAGWGFSQKLESIPLDRVRKKGKKGAAPAATKQDAEGSGRGGDRERSGKERKADRRQDALRRSLQVPQPWTPLSGELGSSSTSGLIAGCGGNRGRGWGPLRGDSGATLKARLGE